MNKLFRCLCLMLALVVLPLGALAAVRMPARRGAVTDDADVLSAQTAADLTEYAELLSDSDDSIGLHVAIVHFLDGLDAQTYADQLFDKWDLDSRDLLVLVAAGEDSCAASMGARAAETLGKANAENLMYTSSDFASLLRTQQYDAAFNAYALSLNALLEKQTGESIALGTLFGSAPKPVEALPIYGSQIWGEVMDALDVSAESFHEEFERHEHEENGLTAGGWIVLLVLVVIVIRQSRPLKHAPHSKRRSGCGCSPLGWLFGLLGLGFLFNRD